MDTSSVIKEFLDENSIKASRSVEVIYRYHAEAERGSRLSGCEIVMRAAEDAVFVRAELPVSVMIGETRGVARYLADLNKRRLDEDEQGYFDLDYTTGRIVFAIRVIQPIETDLLSEVARFCLRQIDKESEALLKVVCEECEAARQEAEEKRQQREKELRGPLSINLLIRGVKRFFRDFPRPSFMKKRQGLIDDLYDDDLEEYEPSHRAGRPGTAGEAARPARRKDAGSSDRRRLFERIMGTGLVAEDSLEEFTDDMLCPEEPGAGDMPSGEEEELLWPEEENGLLGGQEIFLTDDGIDEEIPADAELPLEEDLISEAEGEQDKEKKEEKKEDPQAPNGIILPADEKNAGTEEQDQQTPEDEAV